MPLKNFFSFLYHVFNKKFEEQFNFKFRDMSFELVATYMFRHKDASSLAVTRILFGLAMLFDIPDERGGAAMEQRWGDPKTCHFPLLPYVRALPMPYMSVVYAALWFGALGIMLGYKYRVTSLMFTVCYWYLFLVEKSYWNNHSYLFGLVATLLSCTDASCYWSLDVYLDPAKKKDTVPYWNYFVLKYQFFVLYFVAGLKKGTAEWLSGYSVQNLSEHWVFAPFRVFLTVPQTDYLVVHWFIFVFDLTVAGWMMWARSRHLAMLFCTLFHLMNSRLFRIGMFPWVCLATMPLFYPFDWPKLTLQFIKDKLNPHYQTAEQCCCETESNNNREIIDTEHATEECNCGIDHDPNENYDEDKYDDVFITEKDVDTNEDNFLLDGYEPKDDNLKPPSNVEDETPVKYNKYTLFLIIVYVIVQAFLPFSHFITKGYNNWTNGLYGYSWDMMVHTWDQHSVVVTVVDHDKNAEFYVDPHLLTPNDRWTRHGDMVYQYAQCLKKQVTKSFNRKNEHVSTKPINISIYIDVWCSMNGRFVQRMFDPKVDMLKATWSPFKVTNYLMPMLDEALHWRQTMDELREHVQSWSNYSDVAFFADFPGYDQEKFIPIEIRNVTLTVLDGVVAFEAETSNTHDGQTHKLTAGDRVKVNKGEFHKVLNIGDAPAFYMYTYYNSSEVNEPIAALKSRLPIGTELFRRFANFVTFSGLVMKGVVQSILKLFECQ